MTDLKAFVAHMDWMRSWLSADTVACLRSFLAELLTAREYIPTLERINREQEEELRNLRLTASNYAAAQIRLLDENRELKARLDGLLQR